MDRARLPGDGFGYEAVEEGSRGGTDVVAALGMPLDTEDEVSAWIVRILAAFDGLDDSVLRTSGGDAEAIARDADGLMVAGVDGEAEEVFLLGSFFCSEECAEEGLGGDGGTVGNRDFAACGVVDGKWAEVLYERSAAPGVEDLDAETDGEERLVEVVRVLEEEFVDVFAGWVGGCALGDGIVAVLVRVDVSSAAGKEDGLTGVDEFDGLDRCGVEGDLDGLAAASFNAGCILRPGAPVVVGVGAGGLRDGDAGLHSWLHHKPTSESADTPAPLQ
jgi:hypothetical protein